MDITLNTRLADIGRHYGETGDLQRDIYDNLDAITNDLIDTRIVGDDWGEALDQVLRSEGVEDATVGDLSRALYDGARETGRYADWVARGWKAADFMFRTVLPARLESAPELAPLADRFRALPELASLVALDQAMQLLEEAGKAWQQAKRDLDDAGEAIETALDLRCLDGNNRGDFDELAASDDAVEIVTRFVADTPASDELRARLDA